MTNQITPRDWEALSAYLDGQLAPKERQRLEARLQARADLRAALEELRRTRSVLRARLPVRAPRNFTLTPEMAGIRRQARPGRSLFPALRLASALSTLLFIVVVMGDLYLSGIVGASPAMVAQQREVAGIVTEAPVMEAPAAAAPEAALEATAQPLAKAVESASPTSLPALALPIPMITDAEQAYGGETGAGGLGGGEGEQADQGALSQMAAVATATPLPTPTLAPSATPEPAADQIAGQIAKEELRKGIFPDPALWRWLELALLIVGVGTGLIALYLHRMGHA